MTRRVRVVEVLEFLHLDHPGLLDELRREGLFLEDEIGPEAAEELRVAASLVHELGVNPAGVEVVLQLRRRLACLEGRMRDLLAHLSDEPRKG